MIELYDERQQLWQYDTEVYVLVEDDCTEIHFSNLPYGKSIISKVEYKKAKVPDELLKIRGNLYCYGFIGENGKGRTVWNKVFKINQRPKIVLEVDNRAILGQAKLGIMVL